MRTRTIDLKCYMDGIPVTITQATCVGQVGSPALGVVTVLPHKNLIMDRIHRALVHVFYKEDDEKEWKIFIEGEVYAFAYSKSPKKTLALSIVDLSNYMSAASLWFFNWITYMSAANQPGSPTSLSDYVATNHDFSSKIQSNALAEGVAQPLDIFDTIMHNLPKINTFFSSAEARLKISERFLNYSDSVMVEKFCGDRNTGFQVLLRNAIQGMNAHSTVMDLALAVMNIIFYQIASNPISMNTKAMGNSIAGIKNMLMIPQNPFTAPPMCNVIFPGETDNFLYSRQFTTEPTRMSFETNLYTSKEDMTKSSVNGMIPVYAPSKLDNLIKNFKSSTGSVNLTPLTPASGTSYADLATQNIEALTNEEMTKGIIWVQMPGSFMSPFNTMVEAGIVKGWNDICDFFYFSNKYANRTIQLSCPFKPDLVAGFPMVYMDPGATLYGNIVSYEHTISKTMAKTAIVCSHAHEDEDGIIAYYLPPIFSTDWSPDNIGAKIYANLFGCDSITSVAGTSDIREASKKIKLEYQKYFDKGMGLTYASRVAKRSIPTEEQIFSFIGAWDSASGRVDQNAQAFATLIKDGQIYRDRQDLIKQYAAEVANKGILG